MSDIAGPGSTLSDQTLPASETDIYFDLTSNIVAIIDGLRAVVNRWVTHRVALANINPSKEVNLTTLGAFQEC